MHPTRFPAAIWEPLGRRILTISALNGLPDGLPKFDMVGPTVEDDVRRNIGRYGPEAVKEAVKRQTKPKLGRKPERDWPELQVAINADAREWLAGGDPFSTRSNYSIAKNFADKNPGHSHPATMKRIERKLAKQRLWRTLVTAENVSREDYPFAVHIRALVALSGTGSNPVWARLRDEAISVLADYKAKKGEAPPADLSMKEVEDAARNFTFTMSALAMSKKAVGISGLLSKYT